MARFCDRCKKPIDYVTIYHPTPELADVEGYFCRDCALVLVPEFVKLCDKAEDACRGVPDSAAFCRSDCAEIRRNPMTIWGLVHVS